jgi:hypothetical protein
MYVLCNLAANRERGGLLWLDLVLMFLTSEGICRSALVPRAGGARIVAPCGTCNSIGQFGYMVLTTEYKTINDWC